MTSCPEAPRRAAFRVGKRHAGEERGLWATSEGIPFTAENSSWPLPVKACEAASPEPARKLTTNAPADISAGRVRSGRLAGPPGRVRDQGRRDAATGTLDRPIGSSPSRRKPGSPNTPAHDPHLHGSVSARCAHVTPGMRRRLMLGLTAPWEASLDARLALCPTSPVRVLNNLLRARAVALR
ncbi:hypothetical protein Shyhy01_30740 [Streptomyces hygroscopicus subsp. hygroscopicus]|nr:hypothetical protein Shyhy01_30740 [Streptomyces hygroscopicus subsp. hygroscopicus]